MVVVVLPCHSAVQPGIDGTIWMYPEITAIVSGSRMLFKIIECIYSAYPSPGGLISVGMNIDRNWEITVNIGKLNFSPSSTDAFSNLTKPLPADIGIMDPIRVRSNVPKPDHAGILSHPEI